MPDALVTRACIVHVDDLRVEGLRVAFRVTKSLKKEPNNASIQISNLKESTRAAMRSKGARIVLQAGYEGSLATIFEGDSRTIDHVHEGPTITTKIQCGDGETRYRYACMNESFGAGTPLLNIVGKTVEKLSKKGASGTEKLAAVREGFTQGYTAYGQASKELDKLLKGRGYEWSIQDEQVQILKSGETLAGEAPLLSSDSGMIGSPEHCLPDKKGGPSVLKVKSLLRPVFRCGGRVVLRARDTSGEYRVEKLEHDGDTHGQNWFTVLECRPAQFQPVTEVDEE